jgi:hypothetical protein
MIFQTAVRKYVGIHEKSLSGYFFGFYPQISVIKTKQKFWTKNAENFDNASIFLSNFYDFKDENPNSNLS